VVVADVQAESVRGVRFQGQQLGRAAGSRRARAGVGALVHQPHADQFEDDRTDGGPGQAGAPDQLGAREPGLLSESPQHSDPTQVARAGGRFGPGVGVAERRVSTMTMAGH
jgi:hypothetical protein